MTTKKRDSQPAEEVKDKAHDVNVTDTIARHVLQSLGRPDGLHRVQVRKLWNRHYRVNVFAGVDPNSIRVANSYFLVADDDGKIIESKPPIQKLYE
jgi:hypothetical protein